MALSIKVLHHWDDGAAFHVIADITFTGNYTTGGDALTLRDTAIKTGSVPFYTDVNNKTGYEFRYVPGATRALGKLMTMQNGAINGPAVEIAQAAYPAAILAAKAQFYGIFPKFV